MPVTEGGSQRFEAAGRADLLDQRRDVFQQVAAAAKLMDQAGVAHVGGGVNAVSGSAVAVRTDQTGALPGAQGRGAEAEFVGQRADEHGSGRGARILVR